MGFPALPGSPALPLGGAPHPGPSVFLWGQLELHPPPPTMGNFSSYSPACHGCEWRQHHDQRLDSPQKQVPGSPGMCLLQPPGKMGRAGLLKEWGRQQRLETSQLTLI